MRSGGGTHNYGGVAVQSSIHFWSISTVPSGTSSTFRTEGASRRRSSAMSSRQEHSEHDECHAEARAGHDAQLHDIR